MIKKREVNKLSEKIGIPRSLFYYYYYPAFKTFFEHLGFEVCTSPKTNRKIMEDGIKLAVDDLCLPFKVYFGHVNFLINKVDYILIPKLISFDKKNKFCPKFMGLPDMIRSIFKDKIKAKIIAPDIKKKDKFLPFHNYAVEIGKSLNKSRFDIEKAYFAALNKQKKFHEIERKGYLTEDAIKITNSSNSKINFQKNKVGDKKLKVVVLGHNYIIGDEYLNISLWQKLNDLGVKYITSEMLDDKIKEKAARYQKKNSFWYFNRLLMGTAYHYLYDNPQKIDGIIQVNAFGCGPDSLIKELIDLKAKKTSRISVLNINLDEHSGQEGFITRLEAFIDLLARKKENAL